MDDSAECKAALPWLTSAEALAELLRRFPATDKATLHAYHHTYHHYLAPIAWGKCRGRSVAERTLRLFEVGLGCGMPNGVGGGVQAWRAILPPPIILEMHTMEYDRACGEAWAIANPGNAALHFGDASSKSDLDRVFAATGGRPFDVIIDDGSHLSEHQHATLVGMLPRVRSGGLYVVEDIMSSCQDWPIMQPAQTVHAKRSGGTRDCMKTKRDTPTIFARLVGWQRVLADGRKGPAGESMLRISSTRVRHIHLGEGIAVLKTA
eukprot:4862778-Prymnesium_polylepis.1